jgi:regulator of sirC expression with transglutaminase-like and TPR domain
MRALSVPNASAIERASATRTRARRTSRARRAGSSTSGRRGCFFGRSDAEQWLADERGDGDADDADAPSTTDATESSSFDAAFASLARRKRGLTLFERELAKDEDDVDLLAAATFIAMHANPDLEVDDVRRSIDEMAKIVMERLDADVEERYPLRTVKTISRAWAADLGFKGNVEDYYDVGNSCIDRVLETRTGIPITLCLVYMEIAKRCGVEMVDVGIPGHLLCRPVAEGMEVLVDAFNQGDLLFIEEVEDILSRNSLLVTGEDGKVQIDRSFLTETKVRKKAFLTRMLTNLKAIYFAREDYERALQIVEYMPTCNPYESLNEPLTRTLGVLYFKNERWMDALEMFSRLEASDPEVEAYVERVTRVLALERDVVGGGTGTEENENDNDDVDDRLSHD